MKTTFTHCRRRGFTLLMFLIVLGMMSVGAVLATRLFQSATRTTVATQDAHTRALRFDNMLGQLRRDVWGASAVAATDAKAVDLHRSGGAVRWRIQGDGAVTRDAQGEPQHRWPPGTVAVRFESIPAGLAVHVREDKGGAEQSIILVSQLLLAGGAR